jgi:hypothetical protein
MKEAAKQQGDFQQNTWRYIFVTTAVETSNPTK